MNAMNRRQFLAGSGRLAAGLAAASLAGAAGTGSSANSRLARWACLSRCCKTPIIWSRASMKSNPRQGAQTKRGPLGTKKSKFDLTAYKVCARLLKHNDRPWMAVTHKPPTAEVRTAAVAWGLYLGFALAGDTESKPLAFPLTASNRLRLAR